MRWVWIGLVLSVAACTATPPPLPAPTTTVLQSIAAGDWLTYHRDNQRGGEQYSLVPPGTLSLAWHTKLDGAVYGEPLVGLPGDCGNYVGTAMSMRTDGADAHSYTVPTRRKAGFSGPAGGVLYALDVSKGTARGQLQIGPAPRFASPTLSTDHAYVGTMDGVVSVAGA